MLLVGSLLAVALAAAPAPWFADITESAGVPSLRHGEGVNAVDLDGDTLPELYLPCVRERGRLLKNLGGMRFQEVTESGGLRDRGGVGAAVGDINGDGRPDLYVARGADPYVAPNLLYLQQPDGTFVEASAQAGVAGNSSGLTVTLADFDGDGRLDAFLPGWGKDTLFQNDGAKGFSDKSRTAGISRTGRGWVAVVADFNGDGAPDLFVSHGGYNLPRDNVLYLNRGDGTFADATATSGLADSPWSLGAVSADFDGDGDSDLYVAGYDGPGRLYHNDGKGHFTDVTADSGLTATKSVGAAAGMIDGDLLPDLVVAGFAGPVRIYRNLGNLRFSEVEATGLKPFDHNEGVALADLDGDGDLDLYVANLDGRNRLYRNQLDDKRFIRIRFPRDGRVYVGAVARLSRNGKLLASQALANATGMGQGPEELIFRLPDEGRYDLAVVLPGGRVIEKHDVAPGTMQLP